jgi:hypothetical protein
LIVAAGMAGLFFYSSVRILQQSVEEIRAARPAPVGHGH